MRIVCTFVIFFLAFTSTGNAITITVPTDCPTIQTAIIMAEAGDKVLVLPGVYLENIDFLGKDIVVKSQDGPDFTIIDGGVPVDPDFGSVVIFQNGETQDAVLEGFTLTNGSGTLRIESSIDPDPVLCGGGICCIHDSTPTIQGNKIELNTFALLGGGVFVSNEISLKTMIRDNKILDNTVTGYGGGICARESAVQVIDNLVANNEAGYAGGIVCSGESQILNNEIISNASYNFPSSGGGGITCTGSTLVEGNRILHNHTNGEGGGLHCGEETVIRGNIIGGNWTEYMAGGGGIFIGEGSPQIIDNDIFANQCMNGAGWGGGALVFNSSPLIAHNRFKKNGTYGFGGALCIYSGSPVVRNNRFESNTGGDQGGGICCLQTLLNTRIEGNLFLYNQANNGGGISLLKNVVVTNNRFIANQAKKRGGGCFVGGGGDQVLMPNNTFFSNWADQGGGLFIAGGPFALDNNILKSNQAMEGPAIQLLEATFTISHSLVEGGQTAVSVGTDSTLNWGAGMLNIDPGFVDPVHWDFHLRYDSPCRDAGDSTKVSSSTDFEGDPRIVGNAVDMGADEFHAHLYAPEKAEPGTSIQLHVLGMPGERVWLYRGSEILDPPVHTPYGDWFLASPVVFMGQAGIPRTGHLTFSIRIPPAFPTPSSVPLQATIGNNLSNLWNLNVEESDNMLDNKTE